MSKFNLQEVIDKQGLDAKEIARELFPKNGHQVLALKRILKGEAFLNTEQLSRLSQLTNIPIGELYSGGAWEGSSDKESELVFKSGSYKAVLCTETWVTKIYHNDSLFHDKVIHGGSIALSKYLSSLTEIIDNQ
jgi:hypothetical protein